MGRHARARASALLGLLAACGGPAPPDTTDAAGPEAAPPDSDPDTGPVEDPCGEISLCGACVQAGHCGFCEDPGGANRCADGSSSGPAVGTCGGTWRWELAECSSGGVGVHEFPATGTATEPYRVLLVLVNTTGEIPATSPVVNGHKEYFTPAELGAIYFSHPDGVAAFLSEASYGRVGLSGTVVGWLHEGDLDLDAAEMRDGRDAYFDQACALVDCSTYDVFVLVGRAARGGMNVGWTMANTVTTSHGTFAGVGINFMINSEVSVVAGSGYLSSLVLPSTSWAHELTHTLGLSGHANSLWCSDGATRVTLGGACEQKAYGGAFSLMGEHAWAVHHDFVMKLDLGWLAPGHVTTLDAATLGTAQEVTLYPVASSEPRTRGLVVELGTPVLAAGLTFDRLLVEHRRAAGFDRYLERLDGPDAPDGGAFLARYTSLTDIDHDGVLLYLDSTLDASDTTWLLDAHPTTPYDPDASIKWPGNPGRFADAMLAVGETLDVPDLDVTLAVLALTPDGGVRVRVTPR